jgi:hypothetical protein
MSSASPWRNAVIVTSGDVSLSRQTWLARRHSTCPLLHFNDCATQFFHRASAAAFQ